MLFRDWITEQGLTYDAVARLIGVRHRKTAWRYALPLGNANRVVPPPKTMARIAKVTGGRVAPADFYQSATAYRSVRRKPCARNGNGNFASHAKNGAAHREPRRKLVGRARKNSVDKPGARA